MLASGYVCKTYETSVQFRFTSQKLLCSMGGMIKLSLVKHEDDLPGFDLGKYVIEMTHELEEEIIKGILKQILGREPIPEDAKQLTAYRCEDDNDLLDYHLCYNSIHIGKVVFDLKGHSISVTFKPKKSK